MIIIIIIVYTVKCYVSKLVHTAHYLYYVAVTHPHVLLPDELIPPPPPPHPPFFPVDVVVAQKATAPSAIYRRWLRGVTWHDVK